MGKQIKSKDRVDSFAEVVTNEREVNNILDLVKSETERLESRFLEPACGDGAFLIKVFERKLEILIQKFKKNKYEFEKFSIVMMGSIYGIEILKDNVEKTRKDLFEKYKENYTKSFESKINKNFIKSIEFIINKNIIHGDAVSLMQVDSNEPIVFSEWSVINNKVKRKDFTFQNLLNHEPFGEDTLFSDLGEDVWLPSPKKDYPLSSFDEVFKS